jgi:hypothetical protein
MSWTPRDTGGMEVAMSFERNWTLREERPDYFNSRVTERVMTLNLSIKRRNGRTDDVGRFRIDMEQLAAAGFAHRHVEGGKPRYVMQINHVDGRNFTLGVRGGHATPLAKFAAP